MKLGFSGSNPINRSQHILFITIRFVDENRKNVIGVTHSVVGLINHLHALSVLHIVDIVSIASTQGARDVVNIIAPSVDPSVETNPMERVGTHKCVHKSNIDWLGTQYAFLGRHRVGSWINRGRNAAVNLSRRLGVTVAGLGSDTPQISGIQRARQMLRPLAESRNRMLKNIRTNIKWRSHIKIRHLYTFLDQPFETYVMQFYVVFETTAAKVRQLFNEIDEPIYMMARRLSQYHCKPSSR
jgi:hypothetical protein